jgi:hypothetical protein
LQHLNGTIKKEESDCIVTLSALLGAMCDPQGSTSSYSTFRGELHFELGL